MKEVRFTPKRKEALQQLGIENTLDIIEYYPYRYETVEFLPEEEWKVNSKVVIEGIVTSKPRASRYARNRSVVYFELTSNENIYRISVFNQIWYLKLEPNTHLTVTGRYEGQSRILASSISTDPLEEILGIKPVYSLKDKIKPRSFSQLIRQALDLNRDEIKSVVPASLIMENGLMNRYDALEEVHFPTSSVRLEKALYALKYEEFFRFHCLMISRRSTSHNSGEYYRKNIDSAGIRSFTAILPFELTDDQKKAVNEIIGDMKADFQMCRLLQGDVGSGKTVVSFIAMYGAYLAGQQACLMAPTEILAKQHYENICRTFSCTEVRCGLLYSGLSGAERKKMLEEIREGKIDMVVGTHALFQQDVEFRNLGLVVTDEQHRFGVRQRQLLQEKGNEPDILLMSATPIPRTLANSLYGDMDVSTIEQTPNKGKVIHTYLIKQNSFISVIEQIEKLLEEGNQMYVVCATIDRSDDLPVRNVKDIYDNLNTYFKGRYRLGLLHGQMDEQARDEVQQAFRQHDIDILVATTVIEVGVDVHDANIMIIYDANRFGLSQLHQLRGRIGRGSREGYCYLLTGSEDEEALKRLEVIAGTTDGFKIAYQDLKLRGPGDILGYRQSGLPLFRIGNIIDDSDILLKSRNDAQKVMADPDSSEYETVREYLRTAVADNERIYLD